MKHMNTVHVPATTKQVLRRVTCDLCGIDIKRESFSAEEVEIMHRTGDIFPEGGSGQTVSVDMCGECFDNRLMPWLYSQNVQPTITEWDA